MFQEFLVLCGFVIGFIATSTAASTVLWQFSLLNDCLNGKEK